MLAFALEEGGIVLTNNRKHFIRLHRERSDHAGIVVYTAQLDVAGIARRVDAALRNPMAQGRFLARVDGVGHRFDP